MSQQKPGSVSRVSNFFIRPAEITDAPAISVLCSQLGHPCSAAQVRSALVWIAGQPDLYAVFVAVPEAWPCATAAALSSAPRAAHAQTTCPTVAGWIQVTLQRMLHRPGLRAEITGLVTEERFRHLGVARLLMQRAERWATEMGAADVYLASSAKRTDAHGFYRHIGYEEIKAQRVFGAKLRHPPIVKQ